MEIIMHLETDVDQKLPSHLNKTILLVYINLNLRK